MRCRLLLWRGVYWRVKGSESVWSGIEDGHLPYLRQCAVVRAVMVSVCMALQSWLTLYFVT